jgi:GNAT superfamily N-acetyltransferase
MLSIRPAAPEDVPLILELIRALAAYEKLSEACVATEGRLERSLFGETKYAEALIAEWDGEPAGFALYFHNFSTFLAQPGIYLEDLFVKPGLRGKGIGKALLRRLAKVATERECGRLEWSVLDWNEPSIEFYKGLGAKPLDEWTMFRITGLGLAELAQDE